MTSLRFGLIGASSTFTFNTYKSTETNGNIIGTDQVDELKPNLERKVTRTGLKVPVVETNIKSQYHAAKLGTCYICVLTEIFQHNYHMELMSMNNLTIEQHNDPLSANLGVLNMNVVPFEVRRIYWITDFKKETIRGRHAHKTLTQMMLLLSGNIRITLCEGKKSQTFLMQAGDNPILISPGMWRVMDNASADAVVLVLASHEYDESDYIRDWNTYLRWYESSK